MAMFSILRCKKHYSCCEYFFKPAKLCSTKASNNSLLARISPPKSVLLDKSDYKIVYEFPYIRITAAFLRSRFSFPLAITATLPFLIFLNEGKTSILLLLSACLHFLCVSVYSRISRNIVGFIYVNKEANVGDVIISAVDENGRRIDRRHNPNDFINFDFPNTLSERLGFIKLGLENSDLYYKINVTHCNVYDTAVCNNLFGNIWILPPKSKTTEDDTSKMENEK